MGSRNVHDIYASLILIYKAITFNSIVMYTPFLIKIQNYIIQMLGIYKQSSLGDNPSFIFSFIHSFTICLFVWVFKISMHKRTIDEKNWWVVKKYKLFLLLAILIQPTKHIITVKGKIMIFIDSLCWNFNCLKWYSLTFIDIGPCDYKLVSSLPLKR